MSTNRCSPKQQPSWTFTLSQHEALSERFPQNTQQRNTGLWNVQRSYLFCSILKCNRHIKLYRDSGLYPNLKPLEIIVLVPKKKNYIYMLFK